jgi:hypothetical protein
MRMRRYQPREEVDDIFAVAMSGGIKLSNDPAPDGFAAPLMPPLKMKLAEPGRSGYPPTPTHRIQSNHWARH